MSSSHFLSLPLELRLKIYTLVFHNTIITLHALKDPQPGPPEHDWGSDDHRLLHFQLESELERVRIGRSKTAFLFTNRQIREESLPLFMENVIINLHIGSVICVTGDTRQAIKKMLSALFNHLDPIIARIERLAFFIESTDLLYHEMNQYKSLREVYVWDWKQLCVNETEYFSEVGCGSTRHEEYNRRMAEFLHDKLKLADTKRTWKAYFQHSVCDTTDDVLELGRDRGTFQHQVIPRSKAIISREDMDIENLTAYPLR